MSLLRVKPRGQNPRCQNDLTIPRATNKKELIKALIYDFDCQLNQEGFKAQKWKIIDTSFVEKHRVQRNTCEENELMLSACDYRSQVHKKGKRNQPLNERGKSANRKKSKVRARVERFFGLMKNEKARYLSE